MFPGIPLGLSEHTPGTSVVKGAVALGGCAIEKHFTDDVNREGPDHAFSLDPNTWKAMVDATRELEYGLGSDGIKEVEENEQKTVVVQRRSLIAARDLSLGEMLTEDDIKVLRPAPLDGIFPYEMDKVLGQTLKADLEEGDHIKWVHLG